MKQKDNPIVVHPALHEKDEAHPFTVCWHQVDGEDGGEAGSFAELDEAIQAATYWIALEVEQIRRGEISESIWNIEDGNGEIVWEED